MLECGILNKKIPKSAFFQGVKKAIIPLAYSRRA